MKGDIEKKKDVKIGVSFNGLEPKIHHSGKTSYLSTGSAVIETPEGNAVYEEQIDTNPHPPINQIHFQRDLRGTKVNGKRPKKVKSKIISKLDHEKIEFKSV